MMYISRLRKCRDELYVNTDQQAYKKSLCSLLYLDHTFPRERIFCFWTC
jgi:hypothetical protein